MKTHAMQWPAMASTRLLTLGGALLASLLLSSQVRAQDRPQGQPRDAAEMQQRMQERLDQRVSMLTERLKLSADQSAKVRQILIAERDQMKAFRDKARNGAGADRDANRDANRDAMRTQMRAMREHTEQQIESVLTEQQRTAYRQWRDEQEKDRAARGDPGDRRPRGERPPATAR